MKILRTSILFYYHQKRYNYLYPVPTVTGYMSPCPTFVTATIAHQNASPGLVILES